MDYDICQECINKEGEKSVGHACGDYPDYTYYDPVDMGEEWSDNQAATAKKFVAEAVEEARLEEEAEAKRQAEATRQAEANRQAAARRQAEAERQRQEHARAAKRKVVPAPPSTSRLAPPAARPAARRHSSSGMSFLKGALQITSAVLKAENRVLANQNNFSGGGGGGGGFVDSSGNGGMDMSSFWAPINSAAGDPIQ